VIDPTWVMVVIAAAGIAGQLVIGQRNQGRSDEKLRTLGREMGEVKRDQAAHLTTLDKHGRQLVRIETTLKLPPIGE
jgi:hypothetical protein